MTGAPASPGATPWGDAALAAAVVAVAPHRLGGVAVRALPGPVRDEWLALLAALLPAGMPWRRIPLHVSEGRLLGGLDLAATLRAGRPVGERGLLAEADGGLVVLAMAERVPPATAAHVAAALDLGAVVLERDGLADRAPARFGVVALDEGRDDEAPPSALIDRLALAVDLRAVSIRDVEDLPYGRLEVESARERLDRVRIADQDVASLCAAALALGVDSLRPSLAALTAARAAAALAGREEVAQEDLEAAARLVLAPRATRLPAPEAPPEPQEDEAEPPPEQPAAEQGPEEPREPEQAPPEQRPDPDQPLEDQVLQAARAAIPPHLLALLAPGAGRSRARTAGKSGAVQRSSLRGRPMGVRRGEPRAGARLNVVETLRAAAPWQRLRRAERAAGRGVPGEPVERVERVEVRADDFRTTRFRQRAETTTIFVVDASGSAALHRLAEAKGAVELLLADCYVRRDRVAMIAFRGREAELLLPPTRSLVRGKRCLAELPGGGGTPLAAGLRAATELADAVRRRGGTPVVVLLTDGRANVALDGTHGRERAFAEALEVARGLAAEQVRAILVDTAPRPGPNGEHLAAALGARYLPLPYADAALVSHTVRAASATG